MIPILRRTRHFTVAGMAAGTLVSAGLAGHLALQHHDSASSGTVPSQQPTADSGSPSATPSASSNGNSYNQVPPVTDGGMGGSDSNTRAS